MVIIWLMMINNNLLGGFNPTPLKNHGVSSSVGMMKLPIPGLVNVYILRTGKSLVFMGKSTISMAIFNSYVKLPEGIWKVIKNVPNHQPVWNTLNCSTKTSHD